MIKTWESNNKMNQTQKLYVSCIRIGFQKACEGAGFVSRGRKSII